MNTLKLRFILESDATFGRGDGVAGLVDEEVQHDRYGLPFLNGRTLKGLLRAECAAILFALDRAQPAQSRDWRDAAARLFGGPGSGKREAAILRVGDARLPEDLRQAVEQDFRRDRRLKALTVLESLTALRRQTAMNPETGAPQKETLRTMRVILRGTPFQATLDFAEEPKPKELALLAACVKALRRAGTGRNRGRGQLRADLYAADGQTPVTKTYFDEFAKEVNP